MTHGQAAQRPDINRISECIALKLLKEFREARNRPKDNKGKTFPITQAIVMMYCHIKQLLEDCRELLDKTNLVLVFFFFKGFFTDRNELIGTPYCKEWSKLV